MKKIGLLFLVLLLSSCSATDIYKEKGYGFQKEDNLYTTDHRKNGTLVLWMSESKDHPRLGYIKKFDALQMYALLPNELDQGTSFHGVLPLLPIPFVYWPSFSEKTQNPYRPFTFMLSFVVEDITREPEDFYFSPRTVHIEKDGKKLKAVDIQPLFVHRSVRGRLFDLQPASKYFDQQTEKMNLSQMQKDKSIQMNCTDDPKAMCSATLRNFYYAYKFDLTYKDLEGAVLVIDGLEKGDKKYPETRIKLIYSEGWLYRVMYGP